MKNKMNSDISEQNTCEMDEMLAPSLKRFVKMVKSKMYDQSMSKIQSGDMIQNAENIERKLLGECSDSFGINSPRDSGVIHLDPILHHRVLLSTGIAKSFATGNGLSQKRMKILQSNIEYIENSI